MPLHQLMRLCIYIMCVHVRPGICVPSSGDGHSGGLHALEIVNDALWTLGRMQLFELAFGDLGGYIPRSGAAAS